MLVLENNVPVLAIAEEPEDLGILRAGAASVSLVAATPRAAFAAQQAGFPVRTLEDFYDEAELLALGDAGFEIVAALMDELDAAMGIQASHFPAFSAWYYAYHIKLTYDQALRSLFIASKLLQAFPGHKIHLCLPEIPDHEGPRGIFTGKSRLLSRAMTIAAATDNPEAEAQGICVFSPSPLQSVTKLKSGSPVNWSGTEAPRPLFHPRRWAQILRQQTGPLRDLRLLVTGGLEPEAFGLLSRKGARIWSAKSLAEAGGRALPLSLSGSAPDLSPACRDALNKALSFPVAQGGQKRLSGLPLVESNFQDLLGPIRQWHEDIAPVCDRGLEQTGITAMVGALSMLPAPIAMAAALRRRGGRVANLQHGGFLGYCHFPAGAWSEWSLASDFLAWGPGVRPCPKSGPNPGDNRAPSEDPKDFWLPRSPFRPGTDCHYHDIGSERITKQITRRPPVADPAVVSRKPGKRRILYITTYFMESLRYFSWHIFPDFWYLAHQCRVLSVCAGFPDVEIVFRPPPGEGQVLRPLPEWIAASNFPQIRMERQGSLAALLDDNSLDLIITDAAATTLVEALATDKPVLAIIPEKWHRLAPDAEKLLRQRALVAADSQETENLLRDFLANRISLPDSRNTDFLEEFGGYRKQGEPGQQTMTVITGIAREAAEFCGSGKKRAIF